MYNTSLPSLAVADFRGIEGNFDGLHILNDNLQRVCVSVDKMIACTSKFGQKCTASDSCYECKGIKD